MSQRALQGACRLHRREFARECSICLRQLRPRCTGCPCVPISLASSSSQEDLLGELKAAARSPSLAFNSTNASVVPTEGDDAAAAAAAAMPSAAAATAASAGTGRKGPRLGQRLAGDAPDAIARSQAEARPSPGTGLTGLVNLGNTCFLGAGLQALMCVPHFARSFTELYQTSIAATHSPKRTLLRAMESLVCACASTELDAQSPRDVLGTLRSVNQMFSGYHQHDSHEAMRFILNDIHETAAQRENNWGARHEHLVGPPQADASFSPSSAGAADTTFGAPSDDDQGAIAAAPSHRQSPLLAATSKAAAASASAASVAPDRAGRVAAGRSSALGQRAADEQPGAASRMDPLTAALPASDAESLLDPDARGHWANRLGASRPPPGVPPVPLWCTAGPFVPPPASSRSLVSDAFEGVMCSRVRCRTCKHESVTFDTFTDMSLSIPDSPHPDTDLGSKSAGAASIDQVRRGGFASSGPRRSGWCSFGWGRSLRVEDCLHDFCSPDALTGAEKYSCEKCACLREADKAFAIAKLPEVLCIQLKRFSHTTMWGKLSTRVDFPLEGLDMEPFVWSDSVRAARATAGARAERERRAAAAAAREWVRAPTSPTPDGSAGRAAPPAAPPVLTDTPFSDELAARVVAEHDRAQRLKRRGAAGELLAWGGSPGEGPFEYDLVSFVQHMGTMSGGHYIAYGKEPSEGKWRCFNDEYVTDTSASTVAGQEAYILFFTRRRVAPSAPLPMAMPPPDPSRDSTAIHCWISARWWLRYRVFSCPGPVTSYDVVCPHGRIRNHLLENFTDAATGRLAILSFLVPLTEAQWVALVATFGRQGSPIYDASPCPACALEADALAARRRAEATTISRVDSKSLPSATGDLASPTDRDAAYWHLIGTAWVRNWHSFKDNSERPRGMLVLPAGRPHSSRLAACALLARFGSCRHAASPHPLGPCSSPLPLPLSQRALPMTAHSGAAYRPAPSTTRRCFEPTALPRATCSPSRTTGASMPRCGTASMTSTGGGRSCGGRTESTFTRRQWTPSRPTCWAPSSRPVASLPRTTLCCPTPVTRGRSTVERGAGGALPQRRALPLRWRRGQVMVLPRAAPCIDGWLRQWPRVLACLTGAYVRACLENYSDP